MKKLKIQSLNEDTVNTKYGIKQKFVIQFEQDPNKTVSSFVGNWNKDWKEGMEVEIKDTQWKKNEYKGKTYWNLVAPPEARGTFQGNNFNAFDEIRKQMTALESRVAKLEGSTLKEDTDEVEAKDINF